MISTTLKILTCLMQHFVLSNVVAVCDGPSLDGRNQGNWSVGHLIESHARREGAKGGYRGDLWVRCKWDSRRGSRAEVRRGRRICDKAGRDVMLCTCSLFLLNLPRNCCQSCPRRPPKYKPDVHRIPGDLDAKVE